jgi:GT2 family glycosyltransferase
MISIAIPNYNQGRFLATALDSVLDQSGIELRVAMLDAASTDESLGVIRQYEGRLAYWRSHPDLGQAAAINEGIERLGEADYVGWLNADDLLLPGALRRMAAYLEQRPECVAVFGKAYIVDETGRVTGVYPTKLFSRQRFARTCTICQPASLFRHSAWAAVGGLDESLQMCLDYDFWWRLAKIGAIGFLEEFVACSRDHEATKTRMGQARLYHEAFEVLRRHLGYVPWRWCLSESAYSWRMAHGGRRASDPKSQFLCGWRALRRFWRVNRLSGIGNTILGQPPKQ